MFAIRAKPSARVSEHLLMIQAFSLVLLRGQLEMRYIRALNEDSFNLIGVYADKGYIGYSLEDLSSLVESLLPEYVGFCAYTEITSSFST